MQSHRFPHSSTVFVKYYLLKVPWTENIDLNLSWFFSISNQLKARRLIPYVGRVLSKILNEVDWLPVVLISDWWILITWLLTLPYFKMADGGEKPSSVNSELLDSKISSTLYEVIKKTAFIDFSRLRRANFTLFLQIRELEVVNHELGCLHAKSVRLLKIV